jgi:hypothetical protein
VRLDAQLGLQGVGERRGALVELLVRQSTVAADHRLPVGNGVGDALEQVGDVERKYFASLPWPT